MLGGWGGEGSGDTDRGLSSQEESGSAQLVLESCSKKAVNLAYITMLVHLPESTSPLPGHSCSPPYLSNWISLLALPAH